MYRECQGGQVYENQFWCGEDELSPIKIVNCEKCEHLEDYAYNTNYYDIEEDDYSFGYSSSSSSSENYYQVTYNTSFQKAMP